MANFHSGFVTIIGRPNAGKSTLINALVGEKIAIVTNKPQTTRTRIQGIVNLAAIKGRPAAQIIFVDTPGVHRPDSRLNRKMMHEIHEALQGRDLILLIVDASEKFGTGDQQALELVKQYQIGNRLQVTGNRKSEAGDRQGNREQGTGNREDETRDGNREQVTGDRKSEAAEVEGSKGQVARNGKDEAGNGEGNREQGTGNREDETGNSQQAGAQLPSAAVFLLLNKIDKIPKEKLLPIIEHYRRLHDFEEIIPISAARREGLDVLLERIVHYLPRGPRYFPEDQFTDQPERFLAAELIREKALQKTVKEVPYAIAVMIDNYEELEKLTRIAATIYCEREGQKGILIGKGGERLKEIGTAARLELESLLGKKVFLELFVKVRPEWRESVGFLEELDWRRE